MSPPWESSLRSRLAWYEFGRGLLGDGHRGNCGGGGDIGCRLGEPRGPLQGSLLADGRKRIADPFDNLRQLCVRQTQPLLDEAHLRAVGQVQLVADGLRLWAAHAGDSFYPR